MSPRPWKIRRSFGGYVDAIVDRDGEALCYGAIADSDADAIVARVNACEGINPEAVPELREALQMAIKELDALNIDAIGFDRAVLATMREAVAKAAL